MEKLQAKGVVENRLHMMNPYQSERRNREKLLWMFINQSSNNSRSRGKNSSELLLLFIQPSYGKQ